MFISLFLLSLVSSLDYVVDYGATDDTMTCVDAGTACKTIAGAYAKTTATKVTFKKGTGAGTAENLTLTTDLTLKQGDAVAIPTNVAAAGAYWKLTSEATPAKVVTVDGLVLEAGAYGAISLVTFIKLILQNCDIKGSVAAASSNALIESAACEIVINSLTLHDSTFATHAAGIYFTTYAKLTITPDTGKTVEFKNLASPFGAVEILTGATESILTGAKFTGCGAATGTGALAVGGKVTLKSCVFTGGKGDILYVKAKGINAADDVLKISGCTFTGVTTGTAAATSLVVLDTYKTVTIANDTTTITKFETHKSTGAGAGLIVKLVEALGITDTTFDQLETTLNGGAIAFAEDITTSANKAHTAAILSKVTFTKNKAKLGGAMYIPTQMPLAAVTNVATTTVAATDCVFTENEATGAVIANINGAAVYTIATKAAASSSNVAVADPVHTFTTCTFTKNKCAATASNAYAPTTCGSAVASVGPADATGTNQYLVKLKQVTFSENTAPEVAASVKVDVLVDGIKAESKGELKTTPDAHYPVVMTGSGGCIRVLNTPTETSNSAFVEVSSSNDMAKSPLALVCGAGCTDVADTVKCGVPKPTITTVAPAAFTAADWPALAGLKLSGTGLFPYGTPSITIQVEDPATSPAPAAWTTSKPTLVKEAAADGTFMYTFVKYTPTGFPTAAPAKLWVKINNDDADAETVSAWKEVAITAATPAAAFAAAPAIALLFAFLALFLTL